MDNDAVAMLAAFDHHRLIVDGCWGILMTHHWMLDAEQQLTETDLRGLTPLFWRNVALHGTFELDLDKRMDYDAGADPAA